MRDAVFFDFDDTLIHGDSLLVFLARLLGPVAARAAFIKSAVGVGLGGAGLGGVGLGGAGPGGRRRRADLKGAIKDAVLRRGLRGVSVDRCAAVARAMAPTIVWDEVMLATLRRHRERGDAVVLATGALDLYIKDIAEPIGEIDDFLCTAMEVSDGRCTGAMLGGNCVRVEKARRVRAWIDAHGPFATTIAYGNRPSDVPMFGEVDEGRVVRLRAKRQPSVTPFRPVAR